MANSVLDIRAAITHEPGSLARFTDQIQQELSRATTPLSERFAKRFGSSFSSNLKSVGADFSRVAERAGRDWENKIGSRLLSTSRRLEQIRRQLDAIGRASPSPRLASVGAAQASLNARPGRAILSRQSSYPAAPRAARVDSYASERVGSVLRAARNRGEAKADRSDAAHVAATHRRQKEIYDRLAREAAESATAAQLAMSNELKAARAKSDAQLKTFHAAPAYNKTFEYLKTRTNLESLLRTSAGKAAMGRLSGGQREEVQELARGQRDGRREEFERLKGVEEDILAKKRELLRVAARETEQQSQLIAAREKTLAAAKAEADAARRAAAIEQQRAQLQKLLQDGTREILGNAKNRGYVSARFKSDEEQYQLVNGNLERTNDGTYRRAAGLFRRASTVSVQDGVIQSQEFERRSSGVGRLWTRLAGDGTKTAEAFTMLGTSVGATHKAINALPQGLASLSNGFLRLALVTYGLKHAGEALAGAGLSPLRYVSEQTEKSRQFELGIAQVAGGRQPARELNENLAGRAGKSGLGLDDLREIARQMASTPALATRLVGRGADAQGAEVEKFGKVVNQLATLDPVQGAQGSLVAIREGLSGDLTSLRRRLEINPDALASVSRTSRAKLQSDPELFLKSLEKYADTFIGKESIEGRKNLLSTQLERTQSIFGQQGAAKIGDASFYDAIVSKTKLFNDRLEKYVSGPEFAQQAQRIGGLLVGYVENISTLVQQYARGLTGKTEFADQLRVVIDKAADGFRRVVDVLGALPEAAQKLGEGTNAILGGIGSFVDQMTMLARLASKIGLKGLIPGTDANADFNRVRGLMELGDNGIAAEQAKSADRVRALELLSRERNASSPDDARVLREYLASRDEAKYESRAVTNQYGSTVQVRAHERTPAELNAYLDRAVAQALSPTGSPADAAARYASSLAAARHDRDLVDDLANGKNRAATQIVAGIRDAFRLPPDVRGGERLGRDLTLSASRWLRERADALPGFSEMAKKRGPRGEPRGFNPSVAGSTVNAVTSGLPDGSEFLKAPNYDAAIQYQARFGQLAAALDPLKREIDAARRDAEGRDPKFVADLSGKINSSLDDYINNIAGQMTGVQYLIERAVRELPPEVQDVARGRLNARYQSTFDAQRAIANAKDGIFGREGKALPAVKFGDDLLSDTIRGEIAIDRSNRVTERSVRLIGRSAEKLDVAGIQRGINAMVEQRANLLERLAKSADVVDQTNLNRAIEDLNDAIDGAARARVATLQAMLDRELRATNNRIGDASVLRSIGSVGDDLTRVDPERLRRFAMDNDPASLRGLDEWQLRRARRDLPGQIDRAIGGVDAAQQNLARVREMPGATADDVERASDAVRQQVQVVQQLRDQWLQTTEAMKQYGLSGAQIAESQRDNWMQFAGDVRGAIESNIGQGLSDAILKAGTFGDAMRNLGQQIVRMFVDMQVKNLFLGLFGNAGQTQQGGGGGLFGDFLGAILRGAAGGAAGGYSPGKGPAVTVGSGGSWENAPVIPAARGGVFPGGLRRMASGGIARKPQAAWIGESISNPSMPSAHGEGVLPLAQINGKLGVNAAGLGGGGGGPSPITVITTGNYSEAARAAARAEMASPDGQTLIVDALTGDVIRGGNAHKAIRKQFGR